MTDRERDLVAAAKDRWAERAKVESRFMRRLLDSSPSANRLAEALSTGTVPAGWDPPTEEAQATARGAVARLERAVTEARLPWRDPHISTSPTGAIALEWRNDPRDLTLYVEGRTVGLVRSWGTLIADEMSDDTLDPEDAGALVRLWRWLEQGQDVPFTVTRRVVRVLP